MSFPGDYQQIDSSNGLILYELACNKVVLTNEHRNLPSKMTIEKGAVNERIFFVTKVFNAYGCVDELGRLVCGILYQQVCVPHGKQSQMQYQAKLLLYYYSEKGQYTLDLAFLKQSMSHQHATFSKELIWLIYQSKQD